MGIDTETDPGGIETAKFGEAFVESFGEVFDSRGNDFGECDCFS